MALRAIRGEARLNVIRIHLPPLREWKADIPFIANYFCEKYSKEMGKPIHGIDPEVITRLLAYDFSGSIRELENIIERAVAVARSSTITVASLPLLGREPAGGDVIDEMPTAEITDGFCLDDYVSEIERRLIVSALAKARGVKTDAAKLLGISFRAIRYKIDKYGIEDAEIG